MIQVPPEVKMRTIIESVIEMGCGVLFAANGRMLYHHFPLGKAVRTIFMDL